MHMNFNLFTEKDCLEPPEIAHGNYSRTKTTYEQGTEVEYTCKDGHSIRGRKHIACKQFGQWSDPPTCEGTLSWKSHEFNYF